MAKKKPEAGDLLENLLNPVSTPFPSNPQKEHIDTTEKEDYTPQTKPKKKKIKGFVRGCSKNNALEVGGR